MQTPTAGVGAVRLGVESARRGPLDDLDAGWKQNRQSSTTHRQVMIQDPRNWGKASTQLIQGANDTACGSFARSSTTLSGASF